MNLIDRDKLIEEYARSIATSLVLFGVNIGEKFESAMSMHYALEQAYLRGRVDESERMWMPCSEMLPKEDGRYLVTFSDGTVRECYFRGIDWLYEINEGWHIIAWQPLPPKYEE